MTTMEMIIILILIMWKTKTKKMNKHGYYVNNNSNAQGIWSIQDKDTRARSMETRPDTLVQGIVLLELDMATGQLYQIL